MEQENGTLDASRAGDDGSVFQRLSPLRRILRKRTVPMQRVSMLTAGQVQTAPENGESLRASAIRLK